LRPDRRTAVVPVLRALHAERVVATEEEAMRELSEQLHTAIVDLSGDTTLIAIVRSLQTVWRTQDTGWRRDRRGGFVTMPTDSARKATLVAHEHIIDLIEAGDAVAARSRMRRHLESTQRYPKPPHGTGMIDPTRVRDATARALTWT
jgi:DNA-binding GntR family transcriptional regulator